MRPGLTGPGESRIGGRNNTRDSLASVPQLYLAKDFRIVKNPDR